MKKKAYLHKDKSRILLTIFLSIFLIFCVTSCNQPGVSEGNQPLSGSPDVTGDEQVTPTGITTPGDIITNKPDIVIATPTPFVTPEPAEHAEQEVKFSVDSNFLNVNTEVELSAGTGDKIYYTLNGKLPDETATLYSAPILLKAGTDVQATPITARALHTDGTWSEASYRTYFTGISIDTRYDCLIFSITTDPYNLFDYEYGIFTTGKIRDDYILENPNAEVDGKTPANYHMRGRASERPIYVEILNSDGSLILEQDAGIRTYGGWSRSNAMIPMKLFARKEYDTQNNKFRYPFFTASIDEKGEVIDAFKRLVLRSYGNDNGFGFIREEIFQVLAKQAGYEAKSVRPCAVYVNGEYYGAYFLTEPYHESYFETHYGKYDGVVEIIEGGELFKTGEEDGSNQYALDDYQNMYDKYAYSDLTDDSVYQELNQLMDVTNYLEYYAYNMYLGNTDWPHNNYKTYRYYAADGEEYRENTSFDGRWHYLVHDMDSSTSVYGASVLTRYLSDFLGEIDEEEGDICPLFRELMKREDCREIFVKKTLDLINGVFAPDYFNEQLDLLNQERLNEQSYSYSSGKIASWVQLNQLEERLDVIKEYVLARDSYVYMDMYTFFELDTVRYTLNLTVPGGSRVSVNSFTTDQNFTGKYFSCYSTDLRAVNDNGQTFQYWLVDGVKHMEEELVITEEMLNGTVIYIEPVFE